MWSCVRDLPARRHGLESEWGEASMRTLERLTATESGRCTGREENISNEVEQFRWQYQRTQKPTQHPRALVILLVIPLSCSEQGQFYHSSVPTSV